jgi:peptidoglycan/LPS O-acetylase OafA/YrhL
VTPAPAPSRRLDWLDGVKGLSILWIAFFHFYDTWSNGRLPGPLEHDYWRTFLARCAPESWPATLECVARGALNAVALLGYHAVGVFLLMSGFGLTLSLERRAGVHPGWGDWYRRRLLRLYPMYWTAHLLLLVTPFVELPEPLDHRFWLSLLGDRFWPVDTIFYYLNPAWWYFGLLIQLYLVFPLLYRTLRRVGPGVFLAGSALLTLAVRACLLELLHANGLWVQGAFGASRLFEFAAGMALAVWLQRDPAGTARRLFSLPAWLAGGALYGLGLASHATLLTYSATDGLLTAGLFLLLAQLARLARGLPAIGAALARVGVLSYGFYLVHQPYVIHFGIRLRGLGLADFLVAASGILVLIAAGSMALERGVDRAVERLLVAVRGGRAPAAAG